MSIFNPNPYDFMEQPMFLGEELNVSRFEQAKHKLFEDLTDRLHGQFWRPEETNLSQDSIDFNTKMTYGQQQIFKENIKFQTLMDSSLGRAPTRLLLPIVSDPTLETYIQTWSFSETIHSKSYTHILRNLLSDPSKEFDSIMYNSKILDRAQMISEWCDKLEYNVFKYKLDPQNEKLLEDVQRSLYMSMCALNIVEAIRFYVSFSCTFAFYEKLNILEGNSKIMTLIARDEALHLKGTQYILNQWHNQKESSVPLYIVNEMRDQATNMFIDSVEQEKEWADHLFSFGGKIPGFTPDLIKNYIEYLADQRFRTIGFDSPYKLSKENPIPWMTNYLTSNNVQVAPQEVENSAYLIGQIDSSLSTNELNEFKKYQK